MAEIETWLAGTSRVSDQPTFIACRCPDEGTRTCRRTVANGALHIVRQCQTCGRQVGSALSKKALGPAGEVGLPDFDPEIEERYRQLAVHAITQANPLLLSGACRDTAKNDT